jgi:hypothetical protein
MSARRSMTPLLPILFGLSSWMQTPSADRVKAIAAELARIGFEVDVAKISVEDAKKADCVADMERQQDLFFRRSHFEGIQVLLRGFGLITTKAAKDLRKSTAESLLASFQAYYQPDRKTLVFLGSAADEILAHELTHAWQDQTRGFSRMLPGEKDESARTYEQVRLSQCLIEGEAQLVGGAVMFAREGRKLDTLTPDERALGGRSAVLRCLRRGLAIRCATRRAAHPGKPPSRPRGT